MSDLTLTKHHVFGNDFLVALDTEVDADLARSLCDRHRGIGADGLIGARPWGNGVVMDLYNADGSRAELSGNGLACLAQAVGKPELTVRTDAGDRTIVYEDGEATVDMGQHKFERDGDAVRVDVGNPHLVLRDEGQDLVEIGEAHLDLNVELISVDGDVITMRVHERGVGPTEACGSGACAAFVAASVWGGTGSKMTVRQPGGDAVVEGRGSTLYLTVPVTYIGKVEVPCR